MAIPHEKLAESLEVLRADQVNIGGLRASAKSR